MTHDPAALYAQRILDLRAKRTNHLPNCLFGEHAWAILLILFVADAAGEHVTESTVLARLGGSSSITQCWFAVLKQQGLIAWDLAADANGSVALTPAGIHGVELCMKDALENSCGPLFEDL